MWSRLGCKNDLLTPTMGTSVTREPGKGSFTPSESEGESDISSRRFKMASLEIQLAA